MRSAIACILVLLGQLIFAQEAPVQTMFEEASEYTPEQSAEQTAEQIAEQAPDSQEVTATELDMDDLRKRIFNEAPEELMGYKIGDTDVSLILTGTWYGELQANFGFYKSPVLGTGFASPETPLLFKQEVDLTMALWINQRWFVEANFLDDSSQNTYRAGYQGAPGEFIQYAGVGNTGLDFPVFPYLDLGGDSPSSFGFYGRAGNNKINVHTLVRYDAAASDEKIFTGGRERTYSDIQPPASIRGISFVLPDTNIDSDIIVYIEDDKGTIRDASGRKWRLALNSEYAFSRLMGLLELSIKPAGMVAVTYEKNGIKNPWEVSMGAYSTPGTFLNAVQNCFDPGISKIILENFPQPGSGSLKPGSVYISGANALVIFEHGTFSPFEKRSLYNAPSSNSEKAALISMSSGLAVSGYELVQRDNTSIENIPLFSANDVLQNTADFKQRNIYEVIKSGYADQRDPKKRWPLSDEMPEIYLPGNAIYTGDMQLRFTNYNSVSGYFIGTDVIPGSVQVWRSGIQDSRFTYNTSTGEVTINGSVGQNEVIRITYLKTNEAIQFGSIAAGIGVIYKNRANPFSAQAAVGIRWNLTDDAFTEENQSSAGAVGISLKTAWDYDYLKAQITGGFAFVQTDTTGLYRVAGMEGNEIILYLPFDKSFVSNQFNLQSDYVTLPESKRANLIYRNYYSNNILGDTLMPIDWLGNKIVSDVNKPYPVKDSKLGNTQVLTAEFTLDSNANWTGFQIPLGANGDIISRAGEIEIPFRFYDLNGDINNLKIFVQIGSLSGMDFTFTENPSLIWEQNLVPDKLPDDWTAGDYNIRTLIARFTINEADRQKLSDAKYLRLVAVYDENASGEVSGRILLAPPIVKGSAFRGITYDGNTISGSNNSVIVSETREIGANVLEAKYGDIINRLHTVTGTQRVLKIDWKDEDNVSVGFDGRLTRIPLENYREISFFTKVPDQENSGGFLRFIIAQGPESILNPQLEAKIPLSMLSAELNAAQWKKVTIRYNENNKSIKVDGVNVPLELPLYNKLKSSNENDTSYIIFMLEPDTAASSGTFYIDEIILEDPIMIYRMNAGTAVEYKREGNLVSVAGYPVIDDFKISTAIESEGRAESKTDDPDFTGSMFNRTSLDITFLKTDISGNLSFTAAEDTFLWDADHSISKTVGAFSVKEFFYASPQSNAAQHTINLAFASDFYTSFKADAQYDLSRLRQGWDFDIGYNPKNIYIPAVFFGIDAVWTKEGAMEENENYGEIWLKTWQPLVPDFGLGALTRRSNSQVVLTQRTKPVGAVLSLNGITNYSDANTALRLENSAFLDIPITFDKINFNFRAGRGFRRQRLYSSKDYENDTSMFFSNIEDGFYFWKYMPFYSLFAPELGSAMDKIDPAMYTGFNDHFSARVNLPGNNNLSSFFIPSRYMFRMERILEQKMDTRTDNLNLGGSLGFSAINMFGSMGYKPIFKFYQSDEYSHGIETSVIIPRYEEEIIWGINSILRASFRGSLGSVLNCVNTFAVRSNNYWTESFVFNWEIPTKKNVLSIFYNWILRGVEKQNLINSSHGIFNSNYEQLRKLSMELILDKSSDYLKWNVIAGHEEIVRILGRLNFTTFLKLRLSEDLYTDVFMFDAMLGTTLRLTF